MAPAAKPHARRCATCCRRTPWTDPRIAPIRPRSPAATPTKVAEESAALGARGRGVAQADDQSRAGAGADGGGERVRPVGGVELDVGRSELGSGGRAQVAGERAGALLCGGVLDAEQRCATGGCAVGQDEPCGWCVRLPFGACPGDLRTGLLERVAERLPAAVASVAPAHEGAGDLLGEPEIVAVRIGGAHAKRAKRLREAAALPHRADELGARATARAARIDGELVHPIRIGLDTSYIARVTTWRLDARSRGAGVVRERRSPPRTSSPPPSFRFSARHAWQRSWTAT